VTYRSPLVCSLALLLAAPLAAQETTNSIEGQYLSNIRQVTSGMVKAGEGYFSPDGKQIIYQAQPLDYPFYQIYTQPLSGGTPRRLSTGRGRTTCSYFHPTENKVLFSSSHEDPNLDKTETDARKEEEENKKAGRRPRYKWDFDPYTEIYEADLQGNILKKLTDVKGYDAEAAYSPDGKLIAFCSDRDGDPDLYVMNADGTNVRQLTDAPGYDGGPFISPDGKWIIFRSDRKEKEHLQIYVIGVDGKNETALTDTNGVNWGPYWHPTKPYIIWSGADHSDPNARPNYDLWLAKYEVKDSKFTIGKPVRITDFAGADVLPVFSPDGKQLMWTSTRSDDRSSQLFIADFKLPE
jgi:TolB protein